MHRILLFLLTVLLSGCAQTAQYTWQDFRGTERDDPAFDLAYCRDYTKAQYRPATPHGSSYLDESEAEADLMARSDNDGTWRPDQSPFPVISVQGQSVHDLKVPYTGYPGKLDYSPEYLDDIMEKCMKDRGWEYQPEK